MEKYVNRYSRLKGGGKDIQSTLLHDYNNLIRLELILIKFVYLEIVELLTFTRKLKNVIQH